MRCFFRSMGAERRAFTSFPPGKKGKGGSCLFYRDPRSFRDPLLLCPFRRDSAFRSALLPPGPSRRLPSGMDLGTAFPKPALSPEEGFLPSRKQAFSGSGLSFPRRRMLSLGLSFPRERMLSPGLSFSPEGILIRRDAFSRTWEEQPGKRGEIFRGRPLLFSSSPPVRVPAWGSAFSFGEDASSSERSGRSSREGA